MIDLKQLRKDIALAGEWWVGTIVENPHLGPCFTVIGGSSEEDWDDDGNSVAVYSDEWAIVNAEGSVWLGDNPPDDLMELFPILNAVHAAQTATP